MELKSISFFQRKLVFGQFHVLLFTVSSSTLRFGRKWNLPSLETSTYAELRKLGKPDLGIFSYLGRPLKALILMRL